MPRDTLNTWLADIHRLKNEMKTPMFDVATKHHIEYSRCIGYTDV